MPIRPQSAVPRKIRRYPRRQAQVGSYSGAKWRNLRALILLRDPVCRCGRPTTDADHIITRRNGGQDIPENLKGMCHGCHSAKTNRQDNGWGLTRKREGK